MFDKLDELKNELDEFGDKFDKVDKLNDVLH